MNRNRGLDPEVHKYLDGDRAEHDKTVRADGDRLTDAVQAYAQGLKTPGSEVDRAVMARLRQRKVWEARRESVWEWFLEPQVVHLRPAVAAAALIAVVVGGTWFVNRMATSRAPDSAVVSTVAATVLVRFELQAPEAQTVALAGSFNDWNNDAVQLVRSTEAGVWSATVSLSAGEHEYLFVIDGERWVPDPRAHAQVDDGFGQTNSVITVGPRGVIRS